ncbi:MAG: histidine kinase [Myxococcales bacterium]|nr:histidine kinase [Myxococcales bacterium]
MADARARILIVDDERLNRELLKVLLEAEGYSLASATNGAEALAMVEKDPPDLILLDVMMQGLDGYQLAARLKSNVATKSIPIIMVTVSDDRDAKMRGLNAGAEDFLSKPIDRAELRVRVRNLLRLKAYADYHVEYGQMLAGEVGSRTADLVESERLYRSTFDAAPVGIAHVGLDGRWLRVNRHLCELLGYTPQELQGVGIQELLHSKDVAGEAESFRQLADGTLDRYVVHEKRYRRRDGSFVWVQVNMSVHRDAEGQCQHFISVIEDISDRRTLDAQRRHAERGLVTAREVAVESSRQKSEFVANMSHEIRTPLTAVLGFTDMLLDPKLTVRERLNYTMTIRRNGEHLLSVLNHILDLSKIEAGKLTLERIECSPSQLLNEVASLMRVRATEKKLEFELRYETPIPERIDSDPTRIRQILLNLVTNAVKFTERGKVEIVVRWEETEVGGPRLVVDVIDTGIGIDTENLAKLFQPFMQGDPSVTRRYGGTGLGLGICGPLATALGGTISVESLPGQGSRFRFSLGLDAIPGRRMVSDPSEAPQGASDEQTALGTVAVALSGSILLAEDGRDNQILIATLLRKRGLAVAVAENGRIAIDMALATWHASRPFDVILMDMQMPEVDGYAATSHLRSHGYRGAIVALTAHAMVGERERCLTAGCDDYLVKPVDRGALFSTLRKYLDGAHAAAPPAAAIAPPATLISTFADDPEMQEIVEQFVLGLPAQVEAISTALQLGHRDEVRVLAHQLKGSAGGYGFPSLTEIAGRLEFSARGGSSEAGLALDALRSACARVRSAEPTLETVMDGSEQSLLVIDDSPHIHQLIKARLRPERLIISSALDADHGIALIRNQRPDLVLLDLDLGGKSGLDLCRRLKADPSTTAIPIIFLTGATDMETKVAAFEVGAVDYVTKPFDSIELRARVRAALRTKLYQDLLSTRAQVDGSTRLWNRSFFDMRLKEEFAAAKRKGRRLSVAMLDVDHFKRFNDQHGHPFGDLVLQRVAAALTAVARQSDVVCRYGGEEFGVILRETGIAEGERAAERLCAAVGAISLTAKGHVVNVTISAGVAGLDSWDEYAGLSSSNLLEAADEALYAAKAAGRDRVHRGALVPSSAEATVRLVQK